MIKDFIYKITARIRHPYSLPCEIGKALGLPLASTLSFDQLLEALENVDFQPTTLYRSMPKWEAMARFGKTPKKEFFPDRLSLSYPFSQGWIQFDLIFDQTNQQLRRLFLHHPKLPLGTFHEIRLKRT